jgi:hypothetical protein
MGQIFGERKFKRFAKKYKVFVIGKTNKKNVELYNRLEKK